MSVTVKDDDRVLRQIEAELALLTKTAVTVGVHGDAPPYKVGSGEPIAMPDLALVHEFGSDDGRIPERSFLRSGIDLQQDEILTQLAELEGKVTQGKLSAEQAGEQVGLVVQAEIQRRIQHGEITPALAESTIAQRKNKSDTPLFDTGQLAQSITFVSNQTDPESR